MNFIRIFFFSLIALSAQAQASTLAHPAGLAFEPDASLDLTYQVVPAFDENEKFIVGWAGTQLQYVIAVEKLPPEWVDADAYINGLLRDFLTSGRTVETHASGKYKTRSDMRVNYVEIHSKSQNQTEPTRQIAYFITNGKLSFLAVATLVNKAQAKRALEETKLLFTSAAVSTATQPLPRQFSETPYVGTWQWTGALPDGSASTAIVRLEENLNFRTEVTRAGALIFAANGVWSVSEKRLHWTYINSQPPLPDDKKEDEDEIIALTSDRLVLRSIQSGKETEFRRK